MKAAAYLLATALLGLASQAAAQGADQKAVVFKGVQHVIANTPASSLGAMAGIKADDCKPTYKGFVEPILHIFSYTCGTGQFEALAGVKKFDAYYPRPETMKCATPYTIDMPPNLPKGPAMAVICGQGDHKIGIEIFFIPPIN